jgi:hypothetical protein
MDTKKLSSQQEQYLSLAKGKLIEMKEQIPMMEVGLRVNEILDYLWYVETGDY